MSGNRLAVYDGIVKNKRKCVETKKKRFRLCTVVQRQSPFDRTASVVFAVRMRSFEDCHLSFLICDSYAVEMPECHLLHSDVHKS
jgi:hypothetical protein